MITREGAYSALFTVVSNAYAWASTPSRRLKLFSDVPATARPALFQYEGGPERFVYTNNGPLGQRIIQAKLFIYIDSTDPTLIPSQLMNAILDSIEASLAPPTAELVGPGFNTLGDSVYAARVSAVEKTPGDIDKDGLAVVTVDLLLP